MKKPIIALQLHTVKDVIAIDISETLLKIKDMGYNAVEFSGMPKFADFAEEFREILDVAKLFAFSAQVPYVELERDAKSIINACRLLGCSYVGIQMLEKSHLPGGGYWPTVHRIITSIATQCQDAKLPLMYHNHAYELEKHKDGNHILDQFFEELPGVNAQLDVGGLHEGNQDPVKYIKRYKGRCPVIHIRDVYKAPTGFKDSAIGKGEQDIVAIVKAAIEAGVECFVVDVHNAPYEMQLDVAQQSIDFLHGILHTLLPGPASSRFGILKGDFGSK